MKRRIRAQDWERLQEVPTPSQTSTGSIGIPKRDMSLPCNWQERSVNAEIGVSRELWIFRIANVVTEAT